MKILDTVKLKWHNLTSDTEFSEILTGSVWAIGARVVSTGLALVTSVLVARFYGAGVLGILAILNSFLMLVTIFTVLGTGTSILRLIPEHLAKYSPTSAFKVYRSTQYFVAAVSIVTGGLVAIGSSLIADKVFSKPHLAFFFALAAVFIVFLSLMILNTQAVRGLRLIKIFALMQLLPSLSNLLILVVATLLVFNTYNPIYALFGSFVVTTLIGVVIMDRQFKKKMGVADVVHETPTKEILSISLPMLLTSSMTFLIGQSGVILLGMFRSDAEVGYYEIAVKVATLTTFFLSAINSMAAPKFSELFTSGKMDELFHVAKKSAKLLFWTASPIFIFLILFGKATISLLFGADFSVAYEAMVFLVIGQFVNTISGSTGFFMNMTGHEKVLRNIMLLAAVLNILLNLVLIPDLGILGAALAGMTSLAFWNIFILVYIKLKFGRTIGYIPFVHLR